MNVPVVSRLAVSAGPHWRSMALSLCAGLATPFAFAPYELWPLAIVLPAALLFLLEGKSPRLAASLGWLYGVGLLGHGVWWLQVSIHQFGVPYYLFSAGMTALFVVAMALYYALFAWAFVRLRNASVSQFLVVPALWVGCELLRGWVLSGFPWLTLGYSQIDSPLAAYAPVLGVAGVSYAAVVVAVALTKMRFARPAQSLIAATVAAAVVGGGYAAEQLEFTRATPGRLEAALVQGAIPQAVKWDPRLRESAIALYEKLSEPHWDADLILWPETAIAAFPNQVEAAIARLRARALSTRTSLLIGMPTGDPFGGRYYNSLVSLGPEEGRYDKRHLVPFGEFFPLKGLIGGLIRLLDIPMSDFSAGESNSAQLSAAGHLAGASICYEDAFGREVIDALPEAGFLVNVSNDAWFGDTIAPHQHLEIARMRAIESGRYLLRGTNTGITAIVDHLGAVVAQADQFEPLALRSHFEIRQGATPYVRWGDWPLIVTCLATVCSTAWRARVVARDSG